MPWYRSKTVLTCLLGIAGSWSGVLTGEVTWQAATAATFIGLAGIFMRQGIAKGGE